MIDDRYEVAPKLYVFRCVVTVALLSPEEDLSEEGEPIGVSTHYVRSYGITAAGYGEAAELCSRLAGRALQSPDAEPDGWLDEIEIALMDPALGDESVPLLQPVTQPGVHFASSRIFYDGCEADA